MNKRLEIDDFTSSQQAIKKYIDYRKENCFLHQARVLISSKGKTRFSGIVGVHASIETNYSFVQVIGNTEYERDFHSRYTNEYQMFKFINGTLLIQAEDMSGNAVSIDITAL